MNKTSINSISIDSFFELKKYLQKFSTDNKIFINSHLGNFFSDLSLEQEVLLTNIFETDDVSGMKEFIKNNPNIDVYLDGSGKQKIQQGWKVLEKSLQTVYELIEAKDALTNSEKQILKAKNLKCLKPITEYDLTLITKKLPRESTIRIMKFIDELKDKFDITKFIEKVYTYILINSSIDTTFFEKYIFHFLNLIKNDLNNESKLAKEYIQTINNILKDN